MGNMSVDPLYEMAVQKLASVKKVILIASGKGGVGKSLVAVSLALALRNKGFKVGLLDLDLHGPSTGVLLSVEEKIKGDKHGLVPINLNGLEYMSLALLVGDNPLALKGDVKERLILEIFAETKWSELDFLVVDLPPGTGDETIVPLRLIGGKAVVFVVTTPSRVSISVVTRLLRLLRDEGIPVKCIIENMAYLNLGDRVVKPFGESEIEKVAEDFGIDWVYKLPLDPGLEEVIRKRESPLSSQEWSESIKKLAGFLAEKLKS
ncbi:MAG: ATP-binding protein [Thermoproteales archaeon]|nr:ATP-binding protein [Thermoproteales archaeon]